MGSTLGFFWVFFVGFEKNAERSHDRWFESHFKRIGGLKKTSIVTVSCDLSWSQKHSGVKGQGSGCIRAEGAGLVLMALGGSRSKGGGGG